MPIKNLKLRNIGPFKNAELDFAYEKGNEMEPPVTIITGMNGAGKSIIIDALRGALSGDTLERNIVADINDFDITVDLNYDGHSQVLSTNKLNIEGDINEITFDVAGPLRFGYKVGKNVFPWIVDYWTSKLPNDSFKIQNIDSIDHKNFMKGVMKGRKSNVELTNFLVNIDYMRGSDDENEKKTAETLFKALRDIINQCLDYGEFKYIRRMDRTPIFVQNGSEITLEKLSSGNLMLIEHLVMLLSKMYSLSVLLDIPAEDILKSPGLLLIDEIETHLHPRWQKSILPIIRKTFPNLQIILTTHSPFVVSSLPGARIYTCKSEPGSSLIEDETTVFSTMPVDEILLSDAFNVAPFNNEITELMRSRKDAIENRNVSEARRIEGELIDINPRYFSYLDNSKIDNLLKQFKEIESKQADK